MPILAVLCSSVSWAIATQFFSHVGRQISIFRLNLYKSLFSFVLFVVSVLILNQSFDTFEILWFEKRQAFYLLIASGVAGYALGDLFIFKSFAKMGAARTLMIQSFTPTLVAIYSYFLIGTTLAYDKISGLALLLLCLFFLSRDKKQRFPFQWTTALMAFLGIALDSLGVVFSKMAFDAVHELGSGQANVVRIGAAIPLLLILTKVRGRPLSLKGISHKQTSLVFAGSFFGTFLALYLYLYALSQEKAAIIVGLGSLAPMYASLYEHIRDKIFPSLSFFLAMICMIVGVVLIL